jgi:magnesium-transporting ATPase (P-type)
MTVRELWAGGENFSITGGGYEPKGKIIPAPQSGAPQSGAQQNGNNGHGLKLLLSAAMLCNNSRLSPPNVNRPRWTALGDQTEAALRVLALKGHVNEEELAIALPRIHELPFEARRKRMSTIHSMRDGRQQSWLANLYSGEPDLPPLGNEVAFVKGAPREVLQLCSKIIFADEVRPLDDSFREQIITANDRYARRGLRVLALAFRILAPRTSAYHVETVECDLTFLGLVGMLDPARPQVAEAVQVCKQAGVRLVMITGDYGLTAESLARRVGMLSTPDALILTGAELDGMDNAALYALLEKEIVFARMAPEHKLRLVTAFQARGEVVAVIGDGVNDAPALRKADVGIAMGVSGTDVAKEAADLVLVNDNFAAIIDGIKEGRAIYDNLRKFMTYVFSSNVPEILPFILTALINIPLALTVRQILAIDLGTDMLPGLALGTEEPEPDIMRKPPRRRSQPLIDRSLLVRSFLWLGLIETVLAYTGFILVNYLADNPPSLLPVTVFHAGVVMAQVGNAFAARSEIQRGRKLGWLSNRFLIQGVVVEIGLILLLVYFPPLARAFNHVPIPPILWLWLIAYPVILYGLETIRKFIVRRSGHVVAGSR